MAAVQCSRCSAERKGFRRELDSWRHKLIHCVGFESILEGIYGPLLLRDLNLFEDCEPEEVDDWSSDANCSQCSFCNLPLDKLSVHVPAATSPLSSPSDYSPCQAPTVTESSHSAFRFLQAVFHKKDVSQGSDPNIPLVAQELMKKMIHQFAKEYASKCLLHTSTNGVTTRTSSPLSETSDTPLDLTVSRNQEEKDGECEPDGVLDLSKRNQAASAAPSSNHKASGSRQPSLSEEAEDPGQRGTKCLQSSVLDTILRSLCPSHRSLLYQILKLARQENLLSFVSHRPITSGVDQQENIEVPLSECKAQNSSLYCPFIDCEHQVLQNTIHHSGDSKSNFSINHYPLTDCKKEASLGSSCGCLMRCKMETYMSLCPKRLHCASSLAVGHISDKVCTFASFPSLSKSPSLCTAASSSFPSGVICCNQHNSHSCPCYSNQVCLMQAKNTVDGGVEDGELPCPVLKREQSPSPPPLSPIPSEINKKTDEKPPSLLYQKQEEDLMLSDGLKNTGQQEATTASEEEQDCPSTSSLAVKNPNKILLQDVVNRFSEKLETIKPIEKERPLVSGTADVTEKEKLKFPSTSQNLPFHADAHLTEIITTVLHTGSASDYNLSELFNRHDSNEPKSPNTRSRRRQEVLAAIATPTDDASTRRQTLQIKRELAMLDQSYSRKKVPLGKRLNLKNRNEIVSKVHPSNILKVESKRQMGESMKILEEHRMAEAPLNCFKVESDKDQVKEDFQIVKTEEGEREVSLVENVNLSNTQIYLCDLERENCKQDSKGDSAQEKAMPVTASSVKHGRACKKICKIYKACRDQKAKEALSDEKTEHDNRPGEENDCPSPVRETSIQQSVNEKDTRRSKRNIVLPQRFSSYVTEPMFFVACYSESICNNKSRKNEVSKTSTPDPLLKNQETNISQPESRIVTPQTSPNKTSRLCEVSHKDSNDLSTNQVSPKSVTKEKNCKKSCPNNLTDGENISAKPFARLRSSARRQKSSEGILKKPETPSNSDVAISPVHTSSNSPVQYTSPIKLMYFSPMNDKEGVRYSLKSAGSSGQTEVSFDPCEESSWAGVPQKHKNQSIESCTSGVKCISSPLKSATSTTRSSVSPKSAGSPPKTSANKSAPSPEKSISTPTKTQSPKSTSSSPKTGQRSTEGTPTKRVAGTESQRSPGDLIPYYESTPPKRRPGRPKKLGPQLEQKVKRPIGRPRKQNAVDSATGPKADNSSSVLSSDIEESANKNLKITVVYGRSRRNKRTVSEGFDQLQTELHDAWQAVGLKRDLSILVGNCKTSSGTIKTTSTGLPEKLKVPVKNSAFQSGSNVKCQKQDDSAPLRKPGRPAKVKISGISVTVTTVSPRQRKIQINKDARQSHETLNHKKALLPEFKSAKEPRTINCQSTIKTSHEEHIDTKDENRDKVPNEPAAVRQSMRIKKPSIHFLHAVATSTSRSYSHSNALLRRSKQFLLNKVSNERKQCEQQNLPQTSGGKRQLFGQERTNISRDLGKLAGVSVDSIFTPKETLRWWAASTEGETTNEELARRIRLISDSWVSATEDKQEKVTAVANSKIHSKSNSLMKKRTKHSSVVRSLFDCPPNKPSSCSMQQICHWFMQTTETQSLSIVKKASSRNPYELIHFPRSASRKSVCPSPQAERLRKHMKKFAKIMPKSPLQHQQARRRLKMRKETTPSAHNIRRQLFSPRSPTSKAQWVRKSSFSKYKTILCRTKTRFLTQKKREGWQKRQRIKKKLNRFVESGIQPKHYASCRSTKDQLSVRRQGSSATRYADRTQEPADGPKEQNLCSKAWSPETLKECRVFLRKINSPDTESTEEESDSCTVTLDDGSPSANHFARRERELIKVVKAVKTERTRSTRRCASRDLAESACKSVQGKERMTSGRQNGKYKSPVSTEQPPPTKMFRQSRMRGLTGPRWCDFVFGT